MLILRFDRTKSIYDRLLGAKMLVIDVCLSEYILLITTVSLVDMRYIYSILQEISNFSNVMNVG